MVSYCRWRRPPEGSTVSYYRWSGPPEGSTVRSYLQGLTIGGDVDLVGELRHVDLKAVLHIVEGLGVSLVRHKGDSEALGPEASSTGHLWGGARLN